jgi:excisionase family DNA binding protein
MSEGKLLSVPEVAYRFGVDPSTVRRMLYRGEFDGAFKLGGRWKIPAAVVESYIEGQKQERRTAASGRES